MSELLWGLVAAGGAYLLLKKGDTPAVPVHEDVNLPPANMPPVVIPAPVPVQNITPPLVVTPSIPAAPPLTIPNPPVLLSSPSVNPQLYVSVLGNPSSGPWNVTATSRGSIIEQYKLNVYLNGSYLHGDSAPPRCLFHVAGDIDCSMGMVQPPGTYVVGFKAISLITGETLATAETTVVVGSGSAIAPVPIQNTQPPVSTGLAPGMSGNGVIQNIVVAHQLNNWYQASWDAVPTATSYTWSVHDSTGALVSGASSVSNMVKPLVVVGMHAGDTYTLGISAKAGGSQIGWASLIFVAP